MHTQSASVLHQAPPVAAPSAAHATPTLPAAPEDPAGFATLLRAAGASALASSHSPVRLDRTLAATLDAGRDARAAETRLVRRTGLDRTVDSDRPAPAAPAAAAHPVAAEVRDRDDDAAPSTATATVGDDPRDRDVDETEQADDTSPDEAAVAAAAPLTGLPVVAEIVIPGETPDAAMGLAAEALEGSSAPVRTARLAQVSVAQPLAATDPDLKTDALQPAAAASAPEPVVRSVAAAVQSTPTDSLATPAVIAAVLMEQTESGSPVQAAQAQAAQAQPGAGAQSLPGSIPAAAKTTAPAAPELQAAAGNTASMSGAAGTPSAGNAAVIAADAPPADAVAAPTSGGTARDAGGDPSANGGHAFPGAAAGGVAPTAHAISGGDKPAAVRATLAELPAQLNKAARAGLRHLEIALDPASLGRIDVRLDFAADGRLSALFVADTPEALDALRADAQALQRALADAGIDTGSAGFGFSLRQDSGGSGGSPAHHQASLPPSASVGPGGPDAAASTAEAQRGGDDPSSPRLDIRA